ncbi:MAG: PH domain-containing protein [Sphingorhabdus sp.]
MSEDVATIEAIAESLAEGEGERLHIMGLFIGFITGLPGLALPMVAAVFGMRETGLAGPLVIAAVLLVSLLFRSLAWMRFRFHLDEDDIRIEQGLLNRTVRSIPYDRIQDVSIEQPVLAQIFNLGEVKFETGGGEGEDAKLSFVSMERAEALRATIRAHKSNSSDVVEANEPTFVRESPPLFAMDNNRLVTLGLYSFSLVIFAVLGGLAQQFDFLLPFDFWDFKHWIGIAEERGVSIDGISTSARIIGAVFALLALIALGFATGVVRTVLKEYGFRLDRTERGFRRRRGLLTKTDVVMPVNRVQAANIVTGPIRKRRGWHALKFVSLAQDSKEESDYMAAPLAKLDEIWPIMSEAGITPPSADTAYQRGHFRWWVTGLVIVIPLILTAMAAVVFFAEASLVQSLALLFIPFGLLLFGALEWRKFGFAEDATRIYVRRGWWRQRLTILPQVRVQSVEIAQGPLARIAGLVSVHFGIAGGTLELIAIPREVAEEIRDRVLAIAAPVDFSKA